jgi:hypothetical protein
MAEPKPFFFERLDSAALSFSVYREPLANYPHNRAAGTNERSLRERAAWLNFLSAFASICRTRSRVIEK